MTIFNKHKTIMSSSEILLLLLVLKSWIGGLWFGLQLLLLMFWIFLCFVYCS